MSAPATLNLISRCQGCREMRATTLISFHRNVGMLVIRRTYNLDADLCESCIHKRFWEFTGKNLLLGPWGIISLIVTPIYLLQNIGSYVAALYKLRDAPP